MAVGPETASTSPLPSSMMRRYAAARARVSAMSREPSSGSSVAGEAVVGGSEDASTSRAASRWPRPKLRLEKEAARSR